MARYNVRNGYDWGKWSKGQKMGKIPGLSFSWKRATGVTKAKRNISKATGIPTSKSGRQQKFGKFFGIK